MSEVTGIPSAISEQLVELLPDHWIKQHPESRLAHREQEATKAEERRRARHARRRKLASEPPAAPNP